MDACCFIDAVKQEVGVLPEEEYDDVWYIKKLLEAHREGELRVLTSSLSVAECLAVDNGQQEVPQEVQDAIKRILSSGQYLVLATQTPKTSQIVRNLRWRHNVVFKGADGLHVATALEHSASEFITRDEKLKKEKFKKAKEQLQNLETRFIRASETQYLPNRMRQGQMLDE